jgi:hypothetical protein
MDLMLSFALLDADISNDDDPSQTPLKPLSISVLD